MNSMPAIVVVLLLAPSATLCAADETPVLLRYKFSKTTPLTYRNDTKDKQSLSFMQNDYGNVTESKVKFQYRLLEIDKRGHFVVSREYKRLRETVTAPNVPIYRFDSQAEEHDYASAFGKKLTAMNEAMFKAVVKVTFTPRGEALKVVGFRDLLAPVLKKDPSVAFKVNGGGNEHEQYAVSLRFPVLPVEAVKPGDQWKSGLNIAFGKRHHAKGERQYTFEKWEIVGEQKLVKIAVTSKLKFKIEEIQAEGKVKVISDAAVISASGVALFDHLGGRLVSLKDEFHTLGDKTIFIDGKKIQNFATKSTQTVRTTLLSDP